jgi:hypothetical protein
MRWLACLVWLGGCSLYFGDPESSRHVLAPDAAVVDAAPSCPAPGTSATIMYPANGATGVLQPVPIQYTVYRPLDVDQGLYIHLDDANGQQVDLSHGDPDCTSPQQPYPSDPETWTACFVDLGSGATYTWHVAVVCYGTTTDTTLDLATMTFTTAM